MTYIPNRINEKPQYPYPLDNPPEFNYKLLDFGERPYWSPDGKRIAFVESNYGDICEIDMATREVKNLTKDLGEHHSFLRVLFLPNGDYILIGPAQFKDRHTSRHIESELWLMDKEAKTPPVPLGQRLFEGCGVSRIANRITFAVCGEQDSRIGRKDQFEVHVASIHYGKSGPSLTDDTILYRAENGYAPEPQDFRFDDTEVIMAEYFSSPEERNCTVKGINVATKEVKLYIYEPGTHNECEGIFPHDERFTCLESTAHDTEISTIPTDLWKLKLDGSGQRVRMTRMIDYKPWRATNSNLSPDGKWLAYMINIHGSEAGYGMGLGLLDMEAWEKSPNAQAWEAPDNMK